MEKDINKILITKPEDIKNMDDLEIVLNDVLGDYGMHRKDKAETMDLVMRIIIRMMEITKKRIPFK